MREGTASENVALAVAPPRLVSGRGSDSADHSVPLLEGLLTDPAAADPAEALAQVVLESPGVVSIEPGFRLAVARLWGMAPPDRDLVGVSIRSGRLHVEVDIVVDVTIASALTTVTILHQRLIVAIHRLRWTPGDITISVLDIVTSDEASAP